MYNLITGNLNFRTDELDVRRALTYEESVYKLAFWTEIFLITLNAVFVFFNVDAKPEVPAYIYSLACYLGPDRDISWLKNVTIIAQVWFTICIGVIRLAAQMFQWCILRSFILIGRIISKTPQEVFDNVLDIQSIAPSTILYEHIPFNTYHESVSRRFEKAVQNYKEMKNVLSKYNDIFAAIFVSYKTVSLMFTSIMIYSYLKYRISLPVSATLIFYSAILLHGIRVFKAIYFMGQFYPVSQDFRKNWARYLAWNGLLTERNKALLRSCHTFGFKA
ncbi:unnamed protein product, partial [Allacma fusca]